MAVALSENASKQVKQLKQTQNLPETVFLRMGVKGGGCSGMSYNLEFDSEMGPHDKVFEVDGIKVVVDKKSYIYLNGTTLDYVQQGLTGGLHLRQPPGQIELRLWDLVFGVAEPGVPSRTGPPEGPFVFWASGRSGGEVRTDFFAVFGLERRLAVDVAALQRRFYELSRRWHPDFHQAAPAAEQARALEESARVNAAYRALRDPLARVEYLIRLEEGRETNEGAADKPKGPPALLAEMFEIQEALEAVRAGAPDDATRASLLERRDALRARMAEAEAKLAGPLSQAWDAAPTGERPAALGALKETLATRAYLRTVIDDLGAALGDAEEERHVAHRRD